MVELSQKRMIFRLLVYRDAYLSQIWIEQMVRVLIHGTTVVLPSASRKICFVNKQTYHVCLLHI